MTKDHLESLLVSYGVAYTDALADALIDFFGCEIWNGFGKQIIAPKGTFEALLHSEDKEDDDI